jgi:hypothetical protein
MHKLTCYVGADICLSQIFVEVDCAMGLVQQSLFVLCALVSSAQIGPLVFSLFLTQMFVYYKSLSKPIAQRDFATPPVSASESQRAAAAGASESGHFISAVCWKPNTNTLLAANSSGVVSLCSLTHD